jgi:hypothetical protein
MRPYSQLPADTDKYCLRWLAKDEDGKDKVKKVAAGVGGGALVVSGAIYKYGKKVLDVLKIIKG